MRRPIEDQVVVVTGASSGIGRETALELARRGARVVVGARNEAALSRLADEIRAFGGHVHVVGTDVADAPQVTRLGDEAVRAFGRIDTWINDAAVSEYAMFDKLSDEDFHRIVQVNLMGTVFGTRAAIERMRGRGGMIINIGSVVSDRAVPLQSAYVASKHAVKGFTDSIRMELDHQRAGIHVTLILPTSVNTPFFDHAKSRMGVKGNPIPPVYEPSVVADAIAYAAEHPVRELYVGAPAKFFSLLNRLSPALCDWYMKQGGRMFRQQRSDEPDQGQDVLYRPDSSNGRSRGRFGDIAMRSSAYTRVIERHPNVKRTLVGMGIVATAAALVGAGWATGAGRAPRIKPARRPMQDRQGNMLFDYGFAPVVRSLVRAGIDPRNVRGFDRLAGKFMTAVALNPSQKAQLSRLRDEPGERRGSSAPRSGWCRARVQPEARRA